jgi:hypothetical protein
MRSCNAFLCSLSLAAFLQHFFLGVFMNIFLVEEKPLAFPVIDERLLNEGTLDWNFASSEIEIESLFDDWQD